MVLLHAPALMVREAIQQRDFAESQPRITAKQFTELCGAILGEEKYDSTPLPLLCGEALKKLERDRAAALAESESHAKTQVQLVDALKLVGECEDRAADLREDIKRLDARAHHLRIWIFGLIFALYLGAMYVVSMP